MPSSLRFTALICAMMLYAAGGSPTPDHFSQTESIIAVLLLVACLPGLWRTLSRAVHNAAHQAALLAGLYGILVPTMTGLLLNNDPPAILRDLIAYAFLFLPVLCGDLIAHSASRSRLFIAALITMGALFAARSLIEGHHLPALWGLAPSEALSYLANAPTLLAAACLCLCILLSHLSEPIRSLPKLPVTLICMGVILLTLSAISLSLQRASLGAFGIFALCALTQITLKTPTRGLWVILLLGALFWITLPAIEPLAALYSAFAEKQSLHGLNKRAEEWHAVYQILAHHPASLLFGSGWGAGFTSPATDGDFVTFTHSLISALWLKTGLIGLAIFGLYARGLAQNAVKLAKQAPLTALALSLPIVIDITLYGAYKSLDFGLVLLALSATAQQPKLFGDQTKKCTASHCKHSQSMA